MTKARDDISVKKLNDRVNDHERRLTTLEKSPTSAATQKIPWVPLAALIITLFGSGMTYVYRVDDRVSRLDEKITDPKLGLATRLVKVEDVVKTLANQQSDQTQKLIRDLLSTAQQTNVPGISAKATLLATSLTESLAKERYAAPPDFFAEAISSLNTLTPKAGAEVFAAKIALADYRSAIFRPSDIAAIFAPGSKEGLSIQELESLPRDHDSVIKGFKVFRADKTPTPWGTGMDALGNGGTILLNLQNGDLFNPINGGVPGDIRRISGFALVTPSQTLDDFFWENVVFVNARIRYLGGPVKLINVRFINCTFDFPSEQQTPELQQFLDYAALSQQSLSMGI